MPESSTTTALLAEVDRQLGGQRAQADTFATRSGLLMAATAVLTGVLASVWETGDKLPSFLLVALGGGALAGVLVLCMSRISGGPSTTQISLWMSQGAAIEGQLLQAKLLAIEANARAILRAEVLFFLQAAAAVAGVVTVVVHLKDMT